MITITGRFFRSCTGARQRPELSLPASFILKVALVLHIIADHTVFLLFSPE
ncbi:MAG: hypothetical protein SOX70_01300 [Peptoniphilaceae bacterium]|nr:hypothetical protein [Peptoniphilaceae bacterium]